MKPTPTPEMEAAWQWYKAASEKTVVSKADFRAGWNAALSVQPAAAVVGEPEPIGYCSEYGLDKLASQAHHYCLSVSKAQENEFQFPIYASRISQQDAELERMRREVEEARQVADDRLSDNARLTNEKADALFALAEARKAAFIEAAEIADGHAAEMRPKLAKYLKKGDEHGVAVYESAISEAVSIAAEIRAKVEEART